MQFNLRVDYEQRSPANLIPLPFFGEDTPNCQVARTRMGEIRNHNEFVNAPVTYNTKMPREILPGAFTVIPLGRLSID